MKKFGIFFVLAAFVVVYTVIAYINRSPFHAIMTLLQIMPVTVVNFFLGRMWYIGKVSKLPLVFFHIISIPVLYVVMVVVIPDGVEIDYIKEGFRALFSAMVLCALGFYYEAKYHPKADQQTLFS